MTHANPSFAELSNALALEAIQEIGLSQFTVSATLDIQRPDTLHSFKLFGDALARAFQKGQKERDEIGTVIEMEKTGNAKV